MTTEFKPEWGEISGFGGGYEDTCRAMWAAGVKWWEKNPDADPHFQGYKNVYGIINDENADAKALSKAVTSASDDITGAQHQAVIQHLLAWKRLGPEAYGKQLLKREAKEK